MLFFLIKDKMRTEITIQNVYSTSCDNITLINTQLGNERKKDSRTIFNINVNANTIFIAIIFTTSKQKLLIFK